MPANLPPEYMAVEAAFRKARDPREPLEWLREMLRTIPKHKGTDHLQGDIKRRIKELSEELERPQKRRRTWRSGGGHPARGRSADRADRAAEREQVVPACTATTPAGHIPRWVTGRRRRKPITRSSRTNAIPHSLAVM